MRAIPAALQAHINSGVTTLCRLLKIELADGRVYGATTLDADITYMGITYYAGNGFDSSIIATDASFSTDNAEADSIFAADIPGITAEMALRGELDGATWAMYVVNFNDLTMGHAVLDAGDLGEIKAVRNTIFIPELLSYSARLRQSIGHVDSITCRARFGSPLGTQTGCGIDATAMWVNATVTAVSSDEPYISFLASDVSSISTAVPIWRVRWTTGDNQSSREYQVEALNTVTGQITLSESLPFVIAVGDELQIREDCDKKFTTCRDIYSNKNEFKGENLIPVGGATDTPNANTPGAR